MSRFMFLAVFLITASEVVEALNRAKVQELLGNSSLPVNQLKFRSVKGTELRTPDECREQLNEWFETLQQIRDGKCDNATDDCSDALTQLDAFARRRTPGTQNIYEGSYRTCDSLNEKDTYRRKYCYMIQGDIKGKKCRYDYVSVLSPSDRTAYAFCGPESCHGKDFHHIFDNMNSKPFPIMLEKPVCAVFCSKRNIPKLTMYYVFTSFVILLSSCVFFSSLYDYIRDTRYRLSSETEEVFGQRAILAWSLWSNTICLFRENRPGYIRSLDCIRTITFTWVVGQNVVSHLRFYDSSLRVSGNISLSESALSSLIPIYTYLFMSGLTMTYTFMRTKPSVKVLKRPITWLLFYFHRWIRLTAALVIFIGFFDAYGKYIQGPYDALTGYSMVTQTDLCTYWKDIIHISNFVSIDKMCYLPAWHLAVDFQFTLIAPIFLITYYISTVFGTVLSLIACLVDTGLIFLFFIKNDDLPSAFTGHHQPDDRLIEVILSKPWNQLTCYMFGMITGVYLATSIGSKKVLHPVITGVVWIVVVGIGVSAIMFGNIGTSQAEKAATNVGTRVVWCICLSWIVVSSHLKWAGPITHFMEHPFWRPFGKLSFCAFIVHHMAINHVFNMEQQAPRYISFWHQYFHYTIPISLYSYFVAFFLSVIVEVPFVRLDKIILDKFIPPATPAKEDSDDEKSRDEGEKWDDEEDTPSEGPLLNHEF